jgi:hypothetical protein
VRAYRNPLLKGNEGRAGAVQMLSSSKGRATTLQMRGHITFYNAAVEEVAELPSLTQTVSARCERRVRESRR